MQKLWISIAVLSEDELTRENIKDLAQAVPLVDGMVYSRAPDDRLGIWRVL